MVIYGEDGEALAEVESHKMATGNNTAINTFRIVWIPYRSDRTATVTDLARGMSVA
jgi:hypothetical protein